MNYQKTALTPNSVYTESMRMLDMVIISQLSKTDTKLQSSSLKGVMNPQSFSLETILLKSFSLQ